MPQRPACRCATASYATTYDVPFCDVYYVFPQVFALLPPPTHYCRLYTHYTHHRTRRYYDAYLPFLTFTALPCAARCEPCYAAWRWPAPLLPSCDGRVYRFALARTVTARLYRYIHHHTDTCFLPAAACRHHTASQTHWRSTAWLPASALPYPPTPSPPPTFPYISLCDGLRLPPLAACRTPPVPPTLPCMHLPLPYDVPPPPLTRLPPTCCRNALPYANAAPCLPYTALDHYCHSPAVPHADTVPAVA